MIRRLLPRSIFGRSLLIVLAPMAILQAVMLVVFYERHWEHVTRHLTNAVAGDLSTLIWMMNSYRAEDEAGLVFRIGRMHLGVDALFHPGAQLPSPLPPPGASRVERLLAQAMEQRVQRPFIVDTASLDETALIGVQLPDGVLDVRVPMRRMESRTTALFVFWMVGISFALALIAAYFVRQQIRPIRRLARAADSFGKSGAEVAFKPSGAREVRQAAQAFIAMRERILRQIEQRTLMLAGVSHDLKTPLTRMKLELALHADDERSGRLKADIDEMEHMIEVYLAFARGEGEEATAAVDLAPILSDVARAAPGRVALAVEGPLALAGRPGALKRCFTNLVDNACRHGGRVELAARRQRDALTVTVDDDGPGIPAEARAVALRPFVRLSAAADGRQAPPAIDAARDPNRGGAGLGLTIARDVVHSHGGEIALDDSPLGGLRTRVVLPV